VWAELSREDARAAGAEEGDRVRIESPRGAIEAPVRITDIREGVVFVPFHYGYWDREGTGPGEQPGRAANELTMTSWDPVSKQPLFKVGAVRVAKVA
jgi:anaerobic selenocysteine-containing dehydrogenase